MVKKNTTICDVCDEHVSKWKCEICDKDICNDCTNEISLNFYEDDTLLFDVYACEKCKKQFSRVCLSEKNIFEDVMKDKDELKNEIVELIKNVLMLHKISDEDLEKEKEKLSPFIKLGVPKRGGIPNTLIAPPRFTTSPSPRLYPKMKTITKQHKAWWGKNKNLGKSLKKDEN